MKNGYIMIRKELGISPCVKINTEEEIPKFLMELIKVENGFLVLESVKGDKKVPFGSVIAYKAKLNGDIDIWNVEDWEKSTLECDGTLWEMPRVVSKPCKAVRLSEDLPQFVVDGLGNKITRIDNGAYEINTKSGVVTCPLDSGYLIINDNSEDGNFDVDYLSKESPLFEKYYLVDDKGAIVESLEAYEKRSVRIKYTEKENEEIEKMSFEELKALVESEIAEFFKK